MIRYTRHARSAAATLALGAVALTSACSGGSSANGMVPAAPALETNATATQPATVTLDARGAQASGTLSFAIEVPAAKRTDSRRPAYVSPHTASIAFTLQSVDGKLASKQAPTIAQISASATGCRAQSGSLSCVVKVSAPTGDDLFTIETYASKNGSGRVLATASLSEPVTPGSKLRVPLDLDGVPASLSFSPSRLPLVDDGAVHRVAVAVNAADASGATIVGASPYQSPVGLQIQNDPGGALSLSSSSIAGPGTTLTVTYDSSKTLVDGEIVATDNRMTSATLVAAPLIITPRVVTVSQKGVPASVTLSEAQQTQSFAVSLASSTDGVVKLLAGPPGSGTAVVTVRATVPFDVTSLSVSDGNLTTSVPVDIAPRASYAAFGQEHTILNGNSMVKGPNGLLWASDPGTGSLVSFGTNGKTYTAHVVDPNMQGPYGIAFDASGNLWYADGPQIGEYTPQTGAIVTYSTGLEPSANVTQLIAGPNGTMWFYDSGTFASSVNGGPTYFGSIDTSTGAIVEYQTPSGAGPVTGNMSMVFGDDGSLWYADEYNAKLGRLDTASGAFKEFATGTAAFPQQAPMQLVATPSGKIWFVAIGTGGTSVAGWIDPAHGTKIAYDTNITTSSVFRAFASGPNGELYFVENSGSLDFASVQLTLGIINPDTGAMYEYPSVIPVDAVGVSLVSDGNQGLWMLDSAFGQIGKVTLK
jgi:streptogramin lyase